jgi:Ca2+-dependent lipid-binding protein
MYTTHDNLEHTIKLQEQLFRQRLRLHGIAVDEDHDDDNENESSSSEHLYDNIDGETSDIEKQSTVHKNRLIVQMMMNNNNKKKLKYQNIIKYDLLINIIQLVNVKLSNQHQKQILLNQQIINEIIQILHQKNYHYHYLQIC